MEPRADEDNAGQSVMGAERSRRRNPPTSPVNPSAFLQGGIKNKKREQEGKVAAARTRPSLHSTIELWLSPPPGLGVALFPPSVYSSWAVCVCVLALERAGGQGR